MKKYFLILLLGLFSAIGAKAGLNDLNQRMQFFYQNKNEASAKAILQEISDKQVLEKQPTFQAPFFGFVVGLMIENPQQIEQLKSMNLSQKTHQIILNAEQSVNYTHGNIDMYANPNEIWEPANLDSLWGMFFATGNEKIPEAIRKMIAVDKQKTNSGNINMTVMSAEWSLKANAQKHPIVKKSFDKLEKELSKSQKKIPNKKKNSDMIRPIF